MDKIRRSQFVFTLVELMVTLAVAAILVSIAIPSFTEMIRSNRVVSQANEVLATLQMARSEAAKRGVQVTILKNGNVDSDWGQGWTVFTDLDQDGVNDNEDELLSTQAALANLTLRTGGTFISQVSYLPDGTSRGNDTFRVCPDDANTALARYVAVAVTGRPRVRTFEADKGDKCP